MSFLSPIQRIEKLKGDSGERQYSRVFFQKNSAILAEYPPSKKDFRDFIKVQKLFKQKKIPVPKILKSSFKAGQMLIEDIGNFSLEHFFLKEKKISRHKEALALIYQLQTLIGKKNLHHKFTKKQCTDELKFSYRQMCLFSKKYGYTKEQALFSEFKDIGMELEKNLVPSHRDFHSRNLFIYKEKLYTIDFQSAGYYPIYYDLVSLVEDFYIRIPERQKKLLLNYYQEKWGAVIDQKSFQQTLCQRAFKAMGSFMSFYHLRQKKSHLKYIPQALAKTKKSLQYLNYPHFSKYIHKLIQLY